MSTYCSTECREAHEAERARGESWPIVHDLSGPVSWEVWHARHGLCPACGAQIGTERPVTGRASIRSRAKAHKRHRTPPRGAGLRTVAYLARSLSIQAKADAAALRAQAAAGTLSGRVIA